LIVQSRSQQGAESLQWFILHKKTINILIHKCNEQYTNKQFAEIGTLVLNISMSLMSIIFRRVHWAITKKKPQKTPINIYHLLIFNKLLTFSEHRNRNKPFYIYKGLIQWQRADPASSPWPMYMHESNAIHIQRSSRASVIIIDTIT
jgi:hypothetical protein